MSHMSIVWHVSTDVHVSAYVRRYMSRVGPDSPFALLSPVFGSEIPFEKGFLKNPFSPPKNTTFCPVLGLRGPFARPSISFMHVFCKILVQISSTITIWWKFRRHAPVFPSLNLVVQFYVRLASIFKCNLVIRTSGMARTSFGNGFNAKSSTIFTVKVFLYIEKLLHIWFLWPCFVPEMALFWKIFWPFCPALETSNVWPHPACQTIDMCDMFNRCGNSLLVK